MKRILLAVLCISTACCATNSRFTNLNYLDSYCKGAYLRGSALIEKVSFEQIEKDIVKSSSPIKALFTNYNNKLLQMKAAYQEGDELWSYSVNQHDKMSGYSAWGYMLVRKRTIIYQLEMGSLHSDRL
jgi:hypothetical protein